MGLVLSAEQVARYVEDGFVCPVPALSAIEAHECRRKLEAFEAAQGRPLGQLPGQLRAKTHLLFPWLDDLVRHSAVLAAVEDLVGPDLLVYHLTMWTPRRARPMRKPARDSSAATVPFARRAPGRSGASSRPSK